MTPVKVIDKMIPVKVIESNGEATLIEWRDKTIHRGIFPTLFVKPLMGQDDLDSGAPYGDDFAFALEGHFKDLEGLVNLLHENGIWTEEDILSQQQLAVTLVRTYIGLEISIIREKIHRMKEA